MAEDRPASPQIKRPAFSLPQIARFAITGTANSVVGLFVLLAALRLGYSDVAANFIGFAVGLTLGFVWNRQWTFAVEGRVSPAEVLRYLLSFACAWLLNITVVLIGVGAGYAKSPLVHVAGVMTYSAAFFLMSRSFVFVPSKNNAAAQWENYLGELIVLPLTGLLMLVLRSLPLTHDVVWQLWIARQLVGGVGLYSEINEINPPLWFWMAMPVQQIAAALALSAATVLVWTICLLALISALLVGRIGAFDGPRERAWAMVATLVFGLFTSLYDFGQREQILLITTIPYALLVAARVRGNRPPVLLTAGIAIFASLGFALKHYFALAPLSLELLLLWQLRHGYRPLRTETLVLALLGLTYCIMIAVITPAFVNVMVPMIRTAYFGFETPIWMWFDEPIQVLWVLDLLALYAAGVHRLGRSRPEMQTFSLSALAFFAAYLLQRKGWQYHAIPTSGMLLMLLASLGFAQRQRLADLTSRPLICCVMAFYLAFSFIGRPYANEREPYVSELIRHAPEGAPVLMIVSNPMWPWPAMENLNRVWASRYGAHWMLPAIGRARADHSENPAMLALERTVRIETLTDMRCTEPALILIEKREPNFVARPTDFDTLAFFAEDKTFRDFLAKNYALLADRTWLRAYRRVTPVPIVKPVGCRKIVPPFRTN